jgi:multiple sugar transport system substrate-binding protein
MEAKNVSRRDFLRFTSAVAAGAVLASCSPQQSTSAPAESGAPSEGEGLTTDEITLRMWHWDNFLAEGYEPIAEKFTEEHPNITIAIEMTAYGEYSQKVAASIAGGTPPDVVGTVAEHFTNMAGQDQLIDLKPFADGTNFDVNDYLKGNLSQNSWGGKLLSIPYTSDAMWIFFNKDLFEQKGEKTPYDYWKEGNWTWETVGNVAEKFSSGEGTDKVFGYGGFGYGNYFEVLPALSSNGTSLFDEQYTKCQLDSDAAFDVYNWGYGMRKYAPGAEDQQSGTPQSGRVAMWLDWSPYGLVYAETMPFKYSYAPPPAAPATKKYVYCGDAPGFGILKGVKYTDESWAWIARINERDAIETVFNNTGQEPPRVSMALDPELWNKNTKYPESAAALALTEARMKGGAFYNTPKVSNFLEMWNAHNEELSLAWADSQSLEEALTKANNRINDLLKDANVDQDKLYWES